MVTIRINKICLFVITTLFMFVITSCTARQPIDIGFVGTEVELDAAVRAATEWNSTCKQDLIRIYKGFSKDRVTMFSQAGPVSNGGALGLTHCKSGIVDLIIIQNDSDYSLMQIMAHEFGHAILTCSDADHDTQGIMSATLNPSLVSRDDHLLFGAITQEQCSMVLK